jgi:acetolactate synthase I/II/III large subunit
MNQVSSVRSVAAAYLAALSERGIEHVFANAGTDFAPLIEALVAAAENAHNVPQFITVPHENVALAMAHGYYRVCGRPAAVMVHVNVGTANALCGLMNAARDNIPLLLAAGRTPATEDGDIGSRSVPIHWGQENFDQGAVVREHVKWDYELRAGQSPEMAVGRALDIAMSAPRGPVYLTLPREVLGGAAPPAMAGRRGAVSGVRSASPDAAAIEEAAALIAAAEMPLILTASAGRNPATVGDLAALAERYAIPVAQPGARDVNLPSDHPMSLGLGAGALLGRADVIVVIACEVPWLPRTNRPGADAQVIQIGEDPLYSRFPMRGFDADLAIAGEVSSAVAMLDAALKPLMKGRAAAIARRRAAVAGLRAEAAAARAETLRQAATMRPIHTAWVAACLNEALAGRDAILINEVALPFDYIALGRPGSYMGPSLAGGLGFGLGAALGAKLAAPERDVIAAVGDGSYMFGNPTPSHFVGRAEGLATLTIITNNQMWYAVRMATLGMYPDGRAAGANRLPLVDLQPTPDYAKIIEACGGTGERIEDPAALPAAIARGLAATREGVPALIDVITRPGR